MVEVTDLFVENELKEIFGEEISIIVAPRIRPRDKPGEIYFDPPFNPHKKYDKFKLFFWLIYKLKNFFKSKSVPVHYIRYSKPPKFTRSIELYCDCNDEIFYIQFDYIVVEGRKVVEGSKVFYDRGVTISKIEGLCFDPSLSESTQNTIYEKINCLKNYLDRSNGIIPDDRIELTPVGIEQYPTVSS